MPPPIPTSAAATSPARAEPPMARAAKYVAAGTNAPTAMIAACAARNVPMAGSSATMPMA